MEKYIAHFAENGAQINFSYVKCLEFSKCLFEVLRDILNRYGETPFSILFKLTSAGHKRYIQYLCNK